MTALLARIRNAGRRDCGYCGYGWRHQQHCPLTGRIGSGDGWWLS